MPPLLRSRPSLPRPTRSAGVGLLLVVASATCVGQTGPQSASERRLWQTSATEVAALQRSGLIDNDAALSAYVGAIARRVAPPDGPAPVQVHIVLDPEANAFALPNGHVYVHAGLLAMLDREDQLAQVLGHEVAHVTQRHSAARVDRARGILSAMQILGVAASVGFGVGGGAGAGFWNGLANTGLSLTASLAISGHGRAAEAEADVLAFGHLQQAGYDVCGAPEVFTRLLTRYPDRSGVETFFYGDHPQTSRRLAAATAAAERVRNGPCMAAPRDSLYAARTSGVRARLVELWVRADQPDRALADADRFLQADSTHAGVWAWRAEAGRALGTDEARGRAREDAHQALALDTTLAMVHRTLGGLAEDRGDRAGAREAYAAYLAAQPDAPDRRYIRRRLAELAAPPPSSLPPSPH